MQHASWSFQFLGAVEGQQKHHRLVLEGTDQILHRRQQTNHVVQQEGLRVLLRSAALLYFVVYQVRVSPGDVSAVLAGTSPAERLQHRAEVDCKEHRRVREPDLDHGKYQALSKVPSRDREELRVQPHDVQSIELRTRVLLDLSRQLERTRISHRR